MRGKDKVELPFQFLDLPPQQGNAPGKRDVPGEERIDPRQAVEAQGGKVSEKLPRSAADVQHGCIRRDPEPLHQRNQVSRNHRFRKKTREDPPLPTEKRCEPAGTERAADRLLHVVWNFAGHE